MNDLIEKLKSQNIECEFKEENGIVNLIIHKYDLKDINKIIDLVKEANISVNEILIDLPVDAPSFGQEFLESIKDKNNVYFCSRNNLEKFSINDLIKLENLMDIMVKDIKESNLSPYEKYIAVYDIVRSFKDYKFYQNSQKTDHENPDQSRNAYLILINDWIVCAGYSQLLNSLLKRVGIISIDWTVSDGEHARNYVYIKDDKYHIDGFYMCDPTWDSTQEDIILNPGIHMNMTHDQSLLYNPDLSINNHIFLLDPFEMISYLKDEKKKEKLRKIIATLDPEYYSSIENEFVSYGSNTIFDPDFMYGLVDKNEYFFAHKLCEYLSGKIKSNIDVHVQAEATVRVQEFVNGEKYSDEEFAQKCQECANFIVDSKDKYMEQTARKSNMHL